MHDIYYTLLHGCHVYFRAILSGRPHAYIKCCRSSKLRPTLASIVAQLSGSKRKRTQAYAAAAGTQAALVWELQGEVGMSACVAYATQASSSPHGKQLSCTPCCLPAASKQLLLPRILGMWLSLHEPTTWLCFVVPATDVIINMLLCIIACRPVPANRGLPCRRVG